MELEFMQRAIFLGKEGCFEKREGGPFGAVVVKDNEIVGEGYNKVLKESDPTAHAEIIAIRNAAKNLGVFHLEGCTLYSSAHCCPMCLAACYWAHIEKVFYGAEVEDVKKYGDFEDLDFYMEIQKPAEERSLPLISLGRTQAVEIWKEYQAWENKTHY
jgi:guanine deaminase